MKQKLVYSLIFVWVAGNIIQANTTTATNDISNFSIQAVSTDPTKDSTSTLQSTGSGVSLQQQGLKKPITIAVLTVAGPRRALANDITALFDVSLSSDPRFVVVDRTDLDKVLGEQVLGQSGIITPETAAKIGQLTGAQILVTGREFNLGDKNSVVIIADIISTTNGQVVSQTEQGMISNLVTLISNLSQKIGQRILDQSSNLLVTGSDSPKDQLNMVIQKIKGKVQPSASVEINETILGIASPIAQTELERVLQDAGFIVVDKKSDQRADILITGDALTSSEVQVGNLISANATIEIKARDRVSGKILMLDLQKSVAVDVTKQTAMEQSLKNATDLLAERLLPALAH
jgi:hypothetical protein